MFDAYSPPLEDSTFDLPEADPPEADLLAYGEFDVHSFFPSIKPAAVLAGGPPEAEHLKPQ